MILKENYVKIQSYINDNDNDFPKQTNLKLSWIGLYIDFYLLVKLMSNVSNNEN